MNADTVASAAPAPSLFVTVATKLYARTGVWPSWFVHVVGEEVPHGYVVLALHHRRELERELGVDLPILPLSPARAARTRPSAGGRARRRHGRGEAGT